MFCQKIKLLFQILLPLWSNHMQAILMCLGLFQRSCSNTMFYWRSCQTHTKLETYTLNKDAFPLWASIVFTLEYSETLWILHDSSSYGPYYGLICSPFLRSKFVCTHPSSPPQIMWSPLQHAKKLSAFFMTPFPMASYGLHLWYLSVLIPKPYFISTTHGLLW